MNVNFFKDGQTDATINYNATSWENLDKTSGGSPIQAEFNVSSTSDFVIIALEINPWNSSGSNHYADFRILIDGDEQTKTRQSWRDANEDWPILLSTIVTGMARGKHLATCEIQVEHADLVLQTYPYDESRPTRLSAEVHTVPTSDLTVASDLEDGQHRALFLKIDGLDAYLFERSHFGAPSKALWTDRSDIKVCLRPPVERSMDLDLSTGWSALSQMTFELDNIKDSDGTYFFAKEFSTARWDEEAHNHWRIAAGTAVGQVIDADATTIPLEDSTDVPATPVDLYIGQETISYSGVSGDDLTGVTKGLYPCVGSTNWGHTYPRPLNNEPGLKMSVGSVPFTYFGRRIALYVTTWDRYTNTWHDEGDEELLWVGRISETIQYDPKRQVWKLSCTSILQDYERKICPNMPSTNLGGINLNGPQGLSFIIGAYYIIRGGPDDGDTVAKDSKVISITPGFYNKATDVVREINKQLEDNWNVHPPTTHANVWFEIKDDKLIIETHTMFQYDVKWFVTINPNMQSLAGASHCPALQAIGLDSRDKIEIEIADEITYESNLPAKYGRYKGGQPYIAYHPLNKSYNGNKLYINSSLYFWASQGDYGATMAHAMIRDAIISPSSGEKSKYLFRYDTKTPAIGAVIADNLEGPSDGYIWYYTDGFAGYRDGEDPIQVQQVWMPLYESNTGTMRGPFEMLLYPMLSTGTSGANGTYDTMPLECAGAIQEALVDQASFTDADRQIAADPTAQRSLSTYVIDKAITLKELLLRECKLYGYGLIWTRGKLRLKSIITPDMNSIVTTLDDSNYATPNEKPIVDMPSSTVVNQYKCKVIYNYASDKWGPEIIITDGDSAQSGFKTMMVDIEHPGLNLQKFTKDNIKFLLEKLLLGRYYRFVSPVIERTLAPKLIQKMYLGEICNVISDYIPDPYGSGTLSTSTKAMVINVSWNHRSRTGRCKLLLLARYQNYGSPWCPAAITDQSHTTGNFAGGYSSADTQFKLQALVYATAGDSDDGATFGAGDIVNIVERAPKDPTNPQTFSAVEIASSYETDGAEILTHTGAALVGWDATKEYVVTFADYTDIITSQKAEGVWQADTAKEKLSDGTRAYRYG